MAEISLSNSAGRDAVVSMDSVSSPLRVRWLDPNGRASQSVRFVKSTIHHEFPALVEKAGSAAALSQHLIDGDPEIDFEWIGSFLQNTREFWWIIIARSPTPSSSLRLCAIQMARCAIVDRASCPCPT